MGRRGIPRTPTPVLRLTGSRVVEHRGDADMPPEVMVAPGRPSYLKGDAAYAWDRIVPVLEAIGVLAVMDENALARYCTTWATWRKMCQFIEKHGETYKILNEDGSIKLLQQYPQVAICNRAAILLGRLEQEFGMTPSSRSNLDVKIKGLEDDALAKIQNRRKDGAG